MRIKTHSSIYKISYSGNFNITKIYNYLYSRSTIFLDRKKDLMSTFKPKFKYKGVVKIGSLYEVSIFYKKRKVCLGRYSSLRLSVLIYDYFVRKLNIKTTCNFLDSIKKPDSFYNIVESLYLDILLKYGL